MKPAEIKKTFASPTAYYYHDKGVTAKHITQSPLLRKSLRVLATSKNAAGREFVAILESKKYPIYMAQFHPEKHQFEKRITYKDLDRSEPAIKLMSSFIFRLVDDVRKYSKTIEDIPAEIQSYFSFYNNPVMSPVKSFERIYVFKNFFTTDNEEAHKPKMMRLLNDIKSVITKPMPKVLGKRGV